MPRRESITFPLPKVAKVLGVDGEKNVAAAVAERLGLEANNIRVWASRGVPLDHLERIATASGHRMDDVYSYCMGRLAKLPDRQRDPALRVEGETSNEVGFGEKAFVFGVTRADLHEFSPEKFQWLMDTIARIAEAKYGGKRLAPPGPREHESPDGEERFHPVPAGGTKGAG